MQSTRCSGSETPVAEPQKAADGQRVLRLGLSGLAAFSGSGALLTSFVTRAALCAARARRSSALAVMAQTLSAAYSRPASLRCPASASRALTSRRVSPSLRSSRARTEASATRWDVGRPSHLPVSRFLRWRAPFSLATSDAFSNCATAPSICRSITAVGVS